MVPSSLPSPGPDQTLELGRGKGLVFRVCGSGFFFLNAFFLPPVRLIGIHIVEGYDHSVSSHRLRSLCSNPLCALRTPHSPDLSVHGITSPVHQTNKGNPASFLPVAETSATTAPHRSPQWSHPQLPLQTTAGTPHVPLGSALVVP